MDYRFESLHYLVVDIFGWLYEWWNYLYPAGSAAIIFVPIEVLKDAQEIYTDASARAKEIIEEAKNQAKELEKEADRHLSEARQKAKEILARGERKEGAASESAKDIPGSTEV